MSYDLNFVAREGASLPDRDAIRAYFADRAHFEVDEDRFSYHDPKSGAQFELALSSTRSSRARPTTTTSAARARSP